MAFTLNDTLILWGKYDITKRFNVEEISQVPNQTGVTKNLEVTATGKSIYFEAINSRSSNIFEIIVTRAMPIGTGVTNDFGALAQQYTNTEDYPLSVVDKQTGKVIVKWKHAILQNDSFLMGTISGNEHATVKITWSVSND